MTGIEQAIEAADRIMAKCEQYWNDVGHVGSVELHAILAAICRDARDIRKQLTGVERGNE